MIATANILRESVGSLGCVTRYAGDEFVIFLNTYQEEEVQECIETIKKNVDEYNQTSGKEYLLSLAIGCCSFDLKKQTIEDLINSIDKKMYLDKNDYYIQNPEHDRRKH